MEMHITSPKYGTHIIYFDIEDWDKIKGYSWHVHKSRKRFYARTNITIGKRKQKKIQMHRLLLDCPADMQVDHENMNGMDNRKSNLRICTPDQNAQHRDISIANKSGYKGVHFESGRRKCRASIRENKKQKSLGYFDSPIDAAKAYNEAAIKYYGKFAKLNIIKEQS